MRVISTPRCSSNSSDPTLLMLMSSGLGLTSTARLVDTVPKLLPRTGPHSCGEVVRTLAPVSTGFFLTCQGRSGATGYSEKIWLPVISHMSSCVARANARGRVKRTPIERIRLTAVRFRRRLGPSPRSRGVAGDPPRSQDHPNLPQGP
ncbi:hypothetical protein BV22DRAFT_410093 [Leucogyrophana mollusca]|uniref:Uncharacterized protein n=1 Tax=Leucogyrophana mollusca TaxID=85980 RepID=A0ACB8BLI0_9AGAM|nr:hypothetical protein BV22DRAFT_410093 [Leucogyrophana mollusca]